MKAFNAYKGKKETMTIDKFTHIVRTEEPLLDSLTIYDVTTTKEKVMALAYAAQDQGNMFPVPISTNVTVYSDQVQIYLNASNYVLAEQGYQVTIEVLIIK